MKSILLSLILLLFTSCGKTTQNNESSTIFEKSVVSTKKEFVKEIKVGYKKGATGAEDFKIVVSINRTTNPKANTGRFTSPPYIAGPDQYTCYFDKNLKQQGELYVYIKDVNSKNALYSPEVDFKIILLRHLKGKIYKETIGPLYFDLGMETSYK